MRDIKDFEGLYAVTSCGRVYSYKRKRFLQPYLNSNGYYYVTLMKDNNRYQFRLHRLVADTYIPNPNNLETVDHIDNCKEHNYVGNLQWMTREENTMKATAKPIRCLQNDKIYPSQKAAAQELGLDQGSISKVVRGVMKQTKGYSFEYVIEGEKTMSKKSKVKKRFLATENKNGKENPPIITKINNFMKDNRTNEELIEDLNNFSEIMDFALKNEELLDPCEVWVLSWKKKFLLERQRSDLNGI